ncbi:hypothetical protein NBRC116583_17480 [Arenicella sp. 4NH20-0111]|uniref:M14 family murein peptide amidase A n=1 Tax=Arenicella sp. 4NH20-0111 TaxID=3127648 RepID=UPI003108C0BA
MKIRFLGCTLFIILALNGCHPEDGSKPEENDTRNEATEEASMITQNQPQDSHTENDKEINHSLISIEKQDLAEGKSNERTSNAESALPEPNAEADKLIESIGFAESEDALTIAAPDAEDMPPACADATSPASDTRSISDSEFCTKIGNRLASVSEKACKTYNLQPTGCKSVLGTPLMLKEFPPLEGKDPLGKVLLIGGTHGDELTSVSVVFRWIGTLREFHSGLFHWRVLPVMNPDGLLKRSAERTNENGVDLNRNLPSTDWDKNAIAYWQNKNGKDPRKFPGDLPNSEPETQWLVDEIKRFKPDAIIAVHAPYGVVDFDAQQLNTAPKSLGKLHLNLLGTYPGSLGNYAGINLNIPVITLELPHAWEMPSENDSDKIWEDIVSWLKKNLGNNKSF